MHNAKDKPATRAAAKTRRSTAKKTVASRTAGDGALAVRQRPDSEWLKDLRLERPAFDITEEWRDGKLGYVWRGEISAPPELRDTGRLDRAACLEIYRLMLLNRAMEQQLENLYKQGKVVGGVYFGLGQEGNSVASAYALQPADWMAPLIRNQGSLLVRGFRARDIMMQYMAKAGSPTRGKDGTSHFGDLEHRHVVAPISTLGDLIPVMAGVCLGERMQGRNVAAMTWIGDGGQSTGVFHEGLNFAAVQKLGLVLVLENNLWAYSTPLSRQAAVEDLALRARGYGLPAIIVDGTDPLQVYDAASEACERARAGGGPTLIEAKLMRMKGHAIHDAAAYVPPNLLQYWQLRDPITRFEAWLKKKNWLSASAREQMFAGVEDEMRAERAAAEASPMPDPSLALAGVYCEAGCHTIAPRFSKDTNARAERKRPARAAGRDGHE